MLLAPIAAAMFLPHALCIPTHPPLGPAFAMRKHGAQNSSTMSGFGRHLLNFLLTFPAEMPAEEAKQNHIVRGVVVGVSKLKLLFVTVAFGIGLICQI